MQITIRAIASNKFVSPKYFFLEYQSISVLGKDESCPVELTC